MKAKKVIILTGVSGGIGQAIAESLAKEGHKVYGGARNIEKADSLRKLGVILLPLDVTSEESIRSFVSIVREKEGRIDVLINNAGYGAYGPMETVPIEEAKRELDVNLFGLVRMSQEVIPLMREQKSGTIINMSSMGGKFVTHFGGYYHASKYAVEAVSDAMRMELSPFGINVSIVEPAGICTPFGGIAANNLRESSIGTVYEEEAERVAKGYEKMFSKVSFAIGSPERVGKKVKKIVGKRKPRTRYRVGPFATTLGILRNIIPNRWFDALMKKMMVIASKRKTA